MRKLERLQERGLRAVYRDKDATYSQLLKRAYLPTLLNRRLQDICILMYKVKHKLCPTYICNIFNNHNSSYFLRQSDFSISSYNTVTYGKHSLRYLGPRLWGKLSADVRRTKTLDALKIIFEDVMSVHWWMMAARAVPSAFHSCVILSSYYHHYYHVYINFLAYLDVLDY